MLRLPSTSFLAVTHPTGEAAIARHRQEIRGYIDLCVPGPFANAAYRDGADEMLMSLDPAMAYRLTVGLCSWNSSSASFSQGAI